MKKNIKILLSNLLMILFASSSVAYADVIVTGVGVKTPPTKIVYTAGDVLDLTGLVVTLIKSDASTEDVAFVDFENKGITTNPSNGDVLRVGNKKVTIRVNGETVDQAITVNALPKVTSIAVKTPPTKVTYIFGDALDLTGLVVTLTKSDLSEKDVAFEDFGNNNITTSIKNAAILKTSNKKVTIRAGRAKVNLPITVDVVRECVNTALGIREASVTTALNTFAATMTTVFTDRKNALSAAWLGAPELRGVAIKTAWSAFKESQKTARDTRLSTVRSAWATWKIEAKKCGVLSFSGETQSFDIK